MFKLAQEVTLRLAELQSQWFGFILEQHRGFFTRTIQKKKDTK